MLKWCLRNVLYLIAALSFSSAHAGAYDDFFRALVMDDAGTVASLLQRGFDPNSRDEKGQTALYVAMREGSFKAAERLLAQPGLAIDEANVVGETPLMIAALKGHVEWAGKLISRGARLDRPGWTPLHYAAAGPDAQLVALLAEHGAALDSRSPNGTTPLMMAARYGSEASVQVLLKRGADVRLRNQLELSAADFARQAGRESLARQLEQAAR
jgi:hypothetical protein